MGVSIPLINYGIGRKIQSHYSHPNGLASWKEIRLFLEILTIYLSVFVFSTFDTPRKVRWLSLDEKRMAYARVVDSQTGSDAQKREWKRDRLRAAFRDPQT